jgi:hypothetical protein
VTVTAVLFALGSALIFSDHQQTERFLPTVPQMAGAAAVTVALVGIAFAVGRRPVPGRARPSEAPNAWLVGAAALVASSLFFARPESWLGVAMGVGLVAVMAVVVAGWSRRAGWGGAHRLALAGGALLTYAWGGFVVLSLEGAATTVNLAGQTALVLGAAALLTAAARAVGRAVEAVA